MRLFFLLFTLYGFSHLYFFICLRRIIGPGKWQWFAAAFLLFMAFSWLLRLGRAPGPFSDIIQSATFIWMGFALMLALCLPVVDILSLILRLCAKIFSGPEPPASLAASRWLCGGFAAALLLFAYSAYEAQHPRTVRLTLSTPKISEPLRLVHISDIHVSTLIGPRHLARMQKAVAETQPDILLLTGDLVDTDVSRRHEDAAILRSFPARLAKIAVTGNHESYRGLEQSLAFTKESGFTVLRGTHMDVDGITVAGVDDVLFAGRFVPDTANVAHALKGVDPSRYVVLLNHRPEWLPDNVGHFDLQLSGHTHGGQIWPGGLLTRALSSMEQGLNVLRAPNGATSRLFLTNGIGFWGPPVRFLAPPEVVVITLVPEKALPS